MLCQCSSFTTEQLCDQGGSSQEMRIHLACNGCAADIAFLFLWKRLRTSVSAFGRVGTRAKSRSWHRGDSRKGLEKVSSWYWGVWQESQNNEQEQQQPLICIMVEGISLVVVLVVYSLKACLRTHLSFLPGISKLASSSVISLTKLAKKKKKVQNNPNSKAVVHRLLHE